MFQPHNSLSHSLTLLLSIINPRKRELLYIFIYNKNIYKFLILLVVVSLFSITREEKVKKKKKKRAKRQRRKQAKIIMYNFLSVYSRQCSFLRYYDGGEREKNEKVR